MNLSKPILLSLTFCAISLTALSRTPPEDENPLIPMGAVVGKPDAQTIKKALKGFKDVGITQYLIYPRSGCELEYMSDEWLDTCEKICATAKELGYTSIWLYDEFNWPSGTANKTVMKQNPDFVFRHLNAVKN